MTITRDSERRQAVRRTAVVTFALSILGHVLLLGLLGPAWLARLAEGPPPTPTQEKELEVDAVYEEVREPEPPVDAPQPAAVELSAEMEDAVPARSMELAAREEPSPEPAVLPEPPPAPPPAEAARQEEQSPVIMRPTPRAQALLMPSAEAYEELFAPTDVDARERAREHARGERLFADYEVNDQRMKETLKSFGHVVRPGNHTGVDPQSNAFGSYVGAIHHKIHPRWANRYLMQLDLHEPAGSPMNDPTLNAELEFVIRADDGSIEAVNIVHSSGQVRFDAEAVAVAHRVGPHPGAPPELVSPDGRVYVHWNFWRDQRQCGTFGASVYIVSDSGGSPG